MINDTIFTTKLSYDRLQPSLPLLFVEQSVQETLKQLPVVEGKLAATEKELGELLAEKKRYEESLQQTTEAFIEVQDNISQLEGERNKLKRELEDLIKERDEFKVRGRRDQSRYHWEVGRLNESCNSNLSVTYKKPKYIFSVSLIRLITSLVDPNIGRK